MCSTAHSVKGLRVEYGDEGGGEEDEYGVEVASPDGLPARNEGDQQVHQLGAERKGD